MKVKSEGLNEFVPNLESAICILTKNIMRNKVTLIEL